MERKIYEIYEQICGARLTTNIGRIGGFERDFTDDVNRRINEFIEEFPAALKEFEKWYCAIAFSWTEQLMLEVSVQKKRWTMDLQVQIYVLPVLIMMCV